MKVLVISEDFRKDQFILRPIVSAMMTRIGRPAIVEVLQDPLIGGVDRAMNRQLLEQIVQANRWQVDLFLLCVDRDGDANRRDALDRIEHHIASFLGVEKLLAAENAWQELEVWLLAGLDLPKAWTWQDIRNHRDPKEAYFEELARARKVDNGPGGGRKILGTEAARHYRRIHSRCREDVQVLEKRIQSWLHKGVRLDWCQANDELPHTRGGRTWAAAVHGTSGRAGLPSDLFTG